FMSYMAGGDQEQDTITFSETDFFVLLLTWSVADDEGMAYLNGTMTAGGIRTGLGTWAGNLSSTRTTIGAQATVPTSPWDGSIGPVVVWAGASAPPALQAAAASLAVV
ncbi:hypothetical protein LCGC14_2474300, partial [marine sediment metagenome]